MARIGTRHYSGNICEETQEPTQLAYPGVKPRYLRDFTTSDLASELLRRKRIKWMHVTRALDDVTLAKIGPSRGDFIRDTKFRMAHELVSKLLEDGVFQERQERGICSDTLILGLSLPIFIRHDDGTVK